MVEQNEPDDRQTEWFSRSIWTRKNIDDWNNETPTIETTKNVQDDDDEKGTIETLK